MAGSIYHVYTQTVPDGTATSVVRPSDWNSGHLYSGLPDGIVPAGNTVGVLATISTGTLYLAGGPNVTISQAGNTLSISAGTAAAAPINFSAGTTSGNIGSVVFSNSGGVSFGLNGSTITATVATNYQSQGAYLTTAMQSNAATISNVNISAGTTSSNVSAVTFSNANGISFGYDGTNISATVATNYQSQGAYLTTADLSQNSSKYIQNWKLTGNTAGTTSSAQGTDLWFAGGNGVTISGSSNTLSVSVATSYLASNASTNYVQATAGFNGTNASGTIASNAISISVAAQSAQPAVNAFGVSNTGNTAGNTGTSSGITWVLAASNSLTLSQSTGVGGPDTVWVQVGAYLTTAMQSNAATISDINISAGGSSANVSAITFSNANGVTFGYDKTNITASVAAQSNQPAVNALGVSNTGNTGGNTGTSSGITFVIAASNNITASQSTTPGGPDTVWISGPTLTQYLTTADLSQNSSNYLSAWSLAGAHTAGTTTSAQGVELYLSGGNNITLSGNSNTIVISGPNVGGAQTGISGVADSANTQTVGTISFANSHGVTFGLSTGANTATITASVAAQTNQTLSAIVSSNTVGNTSGMTFDARSVSFQGYGAVSVGLSTTNTGSSILISAPVQSNQPAVNAFGVSNTGNTAGNTGTSSGITWVLAASNSLTLSQSTSAGGPNTVWMQVGAYLTTAMQSNAATISNINISGGASSANVSAITFSNANGVTFGYDKTNITASVANQTNQSGNVYASSNTFGTSSGTYDARSLSIAGSGAVNVAASNSGWVISVAAQTNQSLGFYATGNTTSSASSTTYDARSVSFSGAGAISVGMSGASGIVVSSPVTSSLSATGWASVATNGSTISVGATYTDNFYAVGNTFGTSSGTGDPRTISISGVSGVQIAASNSGWQIGMIPMSVSEPFPIVTGTAYSSHAPASWWFNRVIMDAALAVSNINVVKSLNVAVPLDTLGSSGKNAVSYSHGISIFSRQNYGAQSSNLTTFTTASIGITGSISYTSISASVAYSYVTDTTGGTSSFSTTGSNGSWSNYFSGPFVFQIPCVTTFQAGEYFFAHAHSTTTGTTGNSNFTFLSFSNLHIAPQIVGPLQLPGESITQASLNPWGMGAGIASAVTTNASMAGSVISVQTQNNWYVALSNI